MKQSLRLGTISGIPVGIHWGMLLIAGLYLFTLGGQILPAAVPAAGTGAHWLVAAAGVALFFGSILAHELGHSLVAQREGIRVRAITLWLLGGVAEIERDATTPGAEFRIAAAGPAVSVALAVGFVGGAYAWDAFGIVDPGGGPSLVATMLWWLGIVNGFLAVFNLLPAAPLDGGRILTSLLWWRSGDPYRARGMAARAGQVFALALVGVGAWQITSGAGFWLLVLAWFLYSGATSEWQRSQILGAASRTSTGEVMAPLVSTDGGVTAAGLTVMAGAGRVAWAVHDDGVFVGVVPQANVAAAIRARRETTPARNMIVPWSRFVSARTAERATDVIDRATPGDELHVLVYDDLGRHSGYLGMSELAALRAISPRRPMAAAPSGR
ncbi:MAG: site-2 protease family protein [Acidimicrobiales bacterium]